MAFDWSSWDVVRYCWPWFDDCGDVSGWLSGIATVAATVAAFVIPSLQRRTEMAERERLATELIVEEVYTATKRAAEGMASTDYSANLVFAEANELLALRLLFMDLNKDLRFELQRLLSAMQEINTKLTAIADEMEARRAEEREATFDGRGRAFRYLFRQPTTITELRRYFAGIVQDGIGLLVAIDRLGHVHGHIAWGVLEQWLKSADINAGYSVLDDGVVAHLKTRAKADHARFAAEVSAKGSDKKPEP